MSHETDARVWLRANGWQDVADMIDLVMEGWSARGKKTRRNWWEVLAGGAHGEPRTQGGILFPVLRAAQRRQGKPVTKNAISRPGESAPPPIQSMPRWKGHAKHVKRRARPSRGSMPVTARGRKG